MNILKRTVLTASKTLGLFRLTRFLYRKKLNILCYHAYSYDDEYRFRPSMFMRPDTFRRRLEFIRDNGFTVLSLEEGVRQLKAGTLAPDSIVITIDDGFRSVLDLAVPLLKEADIPATLYVTTYYVEKGAPVFRMLIQYMAWKVGEAQFVPHLSELLGSDAASLDLMQLIERAEATKSNEECVELSRAVATRVALDYDAIVKTGQLSLMTPDEIRRTSEAGVDIQLHTHRHRMPDDPEDVRREIKENRALLEPIIGTTLTHFCYPSGVYDDVHLEPLRELGVTTATTCVPGLNDQSEDPLVLKRFLDNDQFDLLEFESELCGFKEFTRALTAPLRR